MVQTPLAFDFSKTRTICDAFDDAWAFLQARGSDFTEASTHSRRAPSWPSAL